MSRVVVFLLRNSYVTRVCIKNSATENALRRTVLCVRAGAVQDHLRALNLVYVLLYRIDTSARKMAGFTVHRSR